MWIVGVLMLSLFVEGGCENSPRVKVKQGEMEGSEMTTFKGKKFFAFRGIPYAKPPMGTLRFKLPESLNSWEGVLDATKDGPICPQYETQTLLPFYRGQEDCLILNIYTPKLPSQESPILFPVMVFIHGGAFLSKGSTTAFVGPKRIMDQDIVLVTMNYRLGPLGFLSTEDSESVGNFGLWDQRMALVWVQQNIEAFGGDPNLVTLFGQSAGGASVSFHLISPASKGLFHRAIAQSGSSLCHWAIQHEPLKAAQRLAADVSCPSNPTKALVECLREKSPRELMKAAISYFEVSILPIVFSPTVDRSNGSKFLPDEPSALYRDGKTNPVPVILGINAHEALIFVITEVQKMKSMTAESRKKRFEFTLSKFGNIPLNHVPKAVEMYLKDLPLNFHDSKVFYRYVEAASDGVFVSCNEQTVQHSAKTNNRVYMYKMEQELKSLSSKKRQLLGANLTGVVHGEDMILFFDNSLFPNELKDEDKHFSEKIMNMWVNFAKYGDPTSKEGIDVGVIWDPVNPGTINYLRLKLPFEMEYSTPSDKTKFWNNLQKEQKRKEHDEL